MSDVEPKLASAIDKLARPNSAAKAVDFNFVSLLDFSLRLDQPQRRSSESRARIIAAACKVFMVRSYEDVSTYEIAASAGVAQGLIAYHFKSKEGLWQAVMDQIFGEVRNSLSRRIGELRGADPQLLMRELIRHLVELEMTYPSGVRLMLESANQSREHISWLVQRHVKPMFEVITHLLEVGQNLGVLRKLPVANAYYVLLAAGVIFSIKDEIELVAGAEAGSTAFVEAHVRCLCDMLMINPSGA